MSINRRTWVPLVCGLVDAALVVLLPILLAAITGTDVAFVLSEDRTLVIGLLVPLFILTAAWGFYDSRGHLLGRRSLVAASVQGGLVFVAAYTSSTILGIASVAQAVEPPYPVIGEWSRAEWIWYLGVFVKEAVAVALVGTIVSLLLSLTNRWMVGRLPS